MRARLALGSSLLALSCAPSLPPPPPVVTIAADEPSPRPTAAVAVEDPPAPPKPDVKGLVGAWSWGEDIEVFRADGTGVYYRNGELCYEFRYTITGDVVSKVADRDSGCQGRRDNAYRFHFDNGEAVMTHVGSSFETRWTPTRAP